MNQLIQLNYLKNSRISVGELKHASAGLQPASELIKLPVLEMSKRSGQGCLTRGPASCVLEVK